MATKVKAKAVEKKEAKPAAKEKKATIKDLARDLILKNQESDAIIGAVKKAFPESAFNATHVAFYRNQLRKEGYDIETKRKAKGEGKTEKSKPAKTGTKVKSKVKASRKLD